jgi:hypothetical protein
MDSSILQVVIWVAAGTALFLYLKRRRNRKSNP